MTGAVSYAALATDERVTCLRIFADASGETHMQDITIALQPRKLFKDNPPLHLTDTLAASGCNICHIPAGMCEVKLAQPAAPDAGDLAHGRGGIRDKRW
jgi:hypothetical protein